MPFIASNLYFEDYIYSVKYILKALIHIEADKNDGHFLLEFS